MMNLRSHSPRIWFDGIAVVRVTVGVMLILDGWQLFGTHDINDVVGAIFGMSLPLSEAVGLTVKLIELMGGFFLILGLFTSLVTALLFLSFMSMTFLAGRGNFLTDHQLPFLYGMIALLFFFAGAGRLSVDYMIFLNRKEDQQDSRAGTGKRFGQYVTKG